MSKKQEVLRFKEEIRSALSGLNQEFKDIMKKYQTIIPVDRIMIELEADGTDNFLTESAFVVDEEKIGTGGFVSAEELSELEENGDTEEPDLPDDEEEAESRIMASLMAEQKSLVELCKKIPDHVVDKGQALVVLAYKHSKSNAVLFGTHPTKQ